MENKFFISVFGDLKLSEDFVTVMSERSIVPRRERRVVVSLWSGLITPTPIPPASELTRAAGVTLSHTYQCREQNNGGIERTVCEGVLLPMGESRTVHKSCTIRLLEEPWRFGHVCSSCYNFFFLCCYI